MKAAIRPHHQRAIYNLVNEYQNDSRFEALIIGGSVAKGCARADSDIDFMIVANDSEFEKRNQKDDLFINRTDLTDYSNGFVDGKIIDMSYLNMVDKKGNEPTRAAFDGAFLAFSKIQGLEGLIKSIRRYPEELREDKLKSFYAMSFIQNWLMNEAERHNNLYTKSRAASQLVLFTGRLILAHNRVFFPYHKWFYEYLGRCHEKPEGLMDLMNTLLREPNAKHAKALFQTIKDFKAWGVSDIQAFSWFMEKVEWGWMRNEATLEDW
ncbi:nucleotidyltransferase domain-containing protein [Croceitalea rosinachiae]|uniref:Nucleotidyltransferase domain-containing protein n=1 Tax=Croceitalea rosinachiae TaxID=3075596 RepID=A0ABU3A828_9FLAO|nr:nucleotidyltransferase domain-containing protein [Croceitalea sp. F388]MDT0606334.1 nucleotidyltransferase domain-containing protein [Croceitalea sp. F388]